jgi:hypothetical protein
MVLVPESYAPDSECTAILVVADMVGYDGLCYAASKNVVRRMVVEAQAHTVEAWLLLRARCSQGRHGRIPVA